MPLPDRFSLLVLGQGDTGIEVALWAVRHMGSRVSSVTLYGGADSQPTQRTRALERAGVRCVYGTEAVQGSYDICVASPGISEFSEFFRAARGVCAEIMGEPEFSYRLSPDRWCAVTGTNGKTTVTSLINELLHFSGLNSVAVGNIGTVSVHEIDRRAPQEWFVAELSSYQLATTRELHPRIAVLLNITPDHLAWHGTYERYALAKMRLLDNMDDGDVVIANVDDAGLMEFAEHMHAPGCRVLEVSLVDTGSSDAAFMREGRLVVRLDGRDHELVNAVDLQIVGSHNLINALAASAAALVCGAGLDGVRAGLTAFRPLAHRLEPVGDIARVRYVNDSKATNADAAAHGLSAIEGDRVIVLLGGADKRTPLDRLAKLVVARAAAAVCFGEARARFRQALEDHVGHADIDIAEADDLRDAVDVARSLAQRGDVILLSPACASFDEFDSYEERGEAFRSYVAELAASEG